MILEVRRQDIFGKMRLYMKWCLIITVVFLFQLLTLYAHAAPGMKDLGTLGGEESYAYDINDKGQVVGYSNVVGSASYHAFIWENGIMKDLGTLGGEISCAYGINEKGQVVGYSEVVGSSQRHAFIWENGVMKDLGTLGGEESNAYGINEKGQVVGFSDVAGNNYFHAFIWENGVMKDLGIREGNTRAFAINDKGQVVGSLNSKYAFIWQNGVMNYLGTLEGGHLDAYGINETGQAVGEYIFIANCFWKNDAFIWEKGVLKDLGTGGRDTAYDINENGQVVGAYDVNTGEYNQRHAFIWENGVKKDLGTIGGNHSEARSINNKGQVVGSSAIGSSGLQHAFIWENIKSTSTKGRIDTPKNEQKIMETDRYMPSEWAYSEINEAIRLGIVPDDMQSFFKKDITRREFAVLLSNFLPKVTNKDLTTLIANKGTAIDIKFTDTDDEKILNIAKLGIINGVGNNKFDPEASITREQAAKMLMEASKLVGLSSNKNIENFADNNTISEWAKEGVYFCYAQGIMSGTENNNFTPRKSYSREMSIVTIMRLYKSLVKES